MTRTKRTQVALLAAVVATGVAGGAGTAAMGQATGGSISDVGWWTASPAAEAPEGGLAVGAGPSGTVSVGAVRVVLRVDRVDSARLSLSEAGGLQASGAQLQVCPTPNAWSGGPKQPMDRAPKAECERGKVPLTRGADGVWSAEVSSLLAITGERDDVALMVVPAGTGAVPVGFEVQFRPPALDVQGTADDGSSPFSSFSSSSDAESFPSGGGGEPTASAGPTESASPFSPSPSSFSGAGSFPEAAPVPAFGVDTAAAPFETGPTAADTAAAGAAASTGDSSAPVAARPILSGGRGSRYGQGLFFVVVSLAVGVAVGFGHARWRPGDDVAA